MRSFPLFFLTALLGGCSLFRAPLNASFLDGRDLTLAAPGESFVALSGSSCPEACPGFQIFVFESGRILFNGQRNTARLGLVESQTAPSEYYELKRILSVHRAFSRRFHLGCRAGRSGFDVGAVEGERMRAGYLSYGCFNQRDDLEVIFAAFIRISNSAALIR